VGKWPASHPNNTAVGKTAPSAQWVGPQSLSGCFAGVTKKNNAQETSLTFTYVKKRAPDY